MAQVSRSIVRKRRELGWTQKKLAEYLDVDPMSVSRWERGATEPGAGIAKRLRRWLDEDTAAFSPPRHDRSAFPRDADLGVYPAIAELVRIVGTDETLHVLRERALLRRASSAVRFPVDPSIRLEEVERARQQQTDLIGRASIERRDRDGEEEALPQ